MSLWLLTTGAVGRAAPAAVATPALRQAESLRLAEQPQWRRLLFYTARWGGQDSSVVRDPGFYFAPDGRREAAAELAATVAAFYAPIGANPDDHPQCRFPARLAFLRQHLTLAELPQPPCTKLEQWLEEHHPDSAALVFSSYYLNNPASLFGHTFLLLRAAQAGHAAPALLDEAVNFAAVPTTFNPLVYPYLGLTGGFAGYFSLMPYYLKIQEYSNAERRDLWEYPLRLSKDEVHSLMLSLWELGSYPIPYFYMDENCSYMMLMLLEAVRPDTHLTSEFQSFVTPADTVRAAAAHQLLGEPKLRPSSRTRFLARMAVLSPEEQAQVAAVFSAPPAAPLPKLKPAVLDAALDWTYYDEKLAGSKLSVVYKAKQSQLLAERAQAGAGSPLLVPTPSYQRPDLGPYSNLLTLSGGVDGRSRDFAELSWRPTLHDLSSASLGYSSDLEFELLRLTIRRTAGDRAPVHLQNLRLFDALSTPSVQPMLTPLAWHLGIGLEREPFQDEGLRSYIEGGIGLAYATSSTADAPPLVNAYALALVQAGSSPSLPGATFAAPGVQLGLAIEPNLAVPARLYATLRVSEAYSVAASRRLERRLRVSAAVMPSRDVEVGCYAERDDPNVAKPPELAVSAGVFF